MLFDRIKLLQNSLRATWKGSASQHLGSPELDLVGQSL